MPPKTSGAMILYKSLHPGAVNVWGASESRERLGMKDKKKKYKMHLVKSLKIAVAAVIAIAIAGELGLQYSATAGIITVLSIQNTKRETLRSARNRGVAFLVALLLAGICFALLGYTLWAFALYLFLFAVFCLWSGWTEALTTDSVLVSHFLAEGSMAPDKIGNECLIFLIGAGIGVLVNLHLHRKEAKFSELSTEVDTQMKGILQRMSLWLPREDKSEYGDSCFQKLEEALEDAKLCAATNYNNTLWNQDAYELDYIRMRERQSVLLQEIYMNIKKITLTGEEGSQPFQKEQTELPPQTRQVAALLGRIWQEYHRDNTVEGLLEEWQEVMQDMESQELPKTREEFETRAILFYILMQIKNLLMIKREFVLNNF